MKKTAVALLVFLFGIVGWTEAAQAQTHSLSVPAPSNFPALRIGGSAYMGMAHVVKLDDPGDTIKPRIAGGGFVLLDVYFTKMLALNVGFGLMSKGVRYEEYTTLTMSDGSLRVKGLFMEIPVGLKVDIIGIQITGGLALAVGLHGRYRARDDNASVMVKFGDDWKNDEGYRRVNLAFKLKLGYALKAGPVILVPGLDFGVHLIDDIWEPDGRPEAQKEEGRALNLMFGAAVFYGL